MATQIRSCAEASSLGERFAGTRALSAALAAPLSDADATIQPHPDASPAKWHLAHTTWFLETFVLRDFVAGYRAHDERYAFLFNSYYEAEGARHARDRRGMLSRPSLGEILAWRGVVDDAVAQALPALPAAARDLVALGIQHEQQHQELMLADMLAAMAANPIDPGVWAGVRPNPAAVPGPIRWIEGRSGIVAIGSESHKGHESREPGGFSFDCEGPRHDVLLHPHALADRPVTNAEWQGFIADGGYRRPELWLADGWAWVKREGVEAPLYWRRDADGAGWLQFALDGLHAVRPAAPVAHVSQYEADAYARWAGARLPGEHEWEDAARALDPAAGNQLDAAGPARPQAGSRSNSRNADGLGQMFGDVWEWTASAFLPYPGFRPAAGAVGEYNGKFMSGQAVLKGASCATPRGHSRASYRNFFYPWQRWQFSGVRLAKDL